jgi:AMMECR1 domain-containing protein
LEIELSILSPIEPLAFRDEVSARAAMRVGQDGIVFAWRGRRATFLPVMWARLPTTEEFLGALKNKAGLSENFWADDVKLWRYVVDRHVDPPPIDDREAVS